MIGIVESRADEASVHICDRLREVADLAERQDRDRPDADGGGTYYRGDGLELRSFDALHLDLEDVASAFEDPEFVVFASRHAGETGPLLSAHVTGNFGAAEYGGADRSLAAAPPNALAAVLEGLATHAPEHYDVGLECTHHGPTDVGAPSMFVELGSGPEQWADPDGAEAVARAIHGLVDVPAYAPDEGGTRRHLFGIGGGHYAPRFTRIARETDWAIGHVAADWSLSDLGDPETNSDVLAAAFEQSAADIAVLDGAHPAVESVVEEQGYRVVSETWVRATDGVPLPLVERAEERLGSVADGLRFGAPARELAAGDIELRAVDLPSAFLERAQGIDREAALEAVDANAVAYLTEEGGTRAHDRALVAGEAPGADGDLPASLVDALLEILRTRYETVRREDGAIVAETTAFDPELAREQGVPEGPEFGRLADGEAVEVDGRVVEPTDVTSWRQDRFEL